MITVGLLQVARAFLEANEWGQGSYRRQCGDDPSKMSYCALGALIYTDISIIGGYSAARDALADALACDHPELGGWPSVSEWNDAPGRTKDEVLALYDRAIGAERGKL